MSPDAAGAIIAGSFAVILAALAYRGTKNKPGIRAESHEPAQIVESMATATPGPGRYTVNLSEALAAIAHELTEARKEIVSLQGDRHRFEQVVKRNDELTRANTLLTQYNAKLIQWGTWATGDPPRPVPIMDEAS